MRTLSLLSPILLLSLAVTACESGPQGLPNDAPEWVKSPENATRPGVIGGVGSADSSGDAASDLTTAKNRARSDLISKLVTDIKSRFERRVQEQQTNGVITTSIDTYDNIVATTQGELPALTSETTWYDKGNKRHYVKLTVGKADLSFALRASLRRKIEEVRIPLNQALSALTSDEPIDAIEPLQRVEKLMPAAVVIDAQLIALGGAGNDDMNNMVGDRASAFQQVRERITFSIEATQAVPGLDATLGEVVRSLGYRLEGNAAQYRIRTSVTWTRRSDNQGGDAITVAMAQGNVIAVHTKTNSQPLKLDLRAADGQVIRGIKFGASDSAYAQAQDTAKRLVILRAKEILRSALKLK